LLATEPVHVLQFTGTRYDCGSKIGYLRATVEYALRHPDLGENFRAYLQSVWER
jgi:UTP--glucose-1-phosphate uridylyltransferase